MTKNDILFLGGVGIMLVLFAFRKPIKKFMDNTTLDNIIRFIIKYNEGGYLSPERAAAIGDKGGETKYGISKRAYPNLDIKNLTLDQAIDIYKRDYLPFVWKVLPNSTDPNMVYQIWDMAINAGPATALKLYKPGMSVADYKKARIEKHYSKISGWKHENTKKSWTNRTVRNFV